MKKVQSFILQTKSTSESSNLTLERVEVPIEDISDNLKESRYCNRR